MQYVVYVFFVNSYSLSNHCLLTVRSSCITPFSIFQTGFVMGERPKREPPLTFSRASVHCSTRLLVKDVCFSKSFIWNFTTMCSCIIRLIMFLIKQKPYTNEGHGEIAFLKMSVVYFLKRNCSALCISSVDSSISLFYSATTYIG